jgi:predicted DNA-binding transcriptional regulator AlpA
MSQTVDDLRILRFEEVAIQLGYSTKHVERICAGDDGPKVTKLSPKRRGIRADHFREWLDARAKRDEEASEQHDDKSESLAVTKEHDQKTIASGPPGSNPRFTRAEQVANSRFRQPARLRDRNNP